MEKLRQWQKVKEIVGSALERPRSGPPILTRPVQTIRSCARKSNRCCPLIAARTGFRKARGTMRRRNPERNRRLSAHTVCSESSVSAAWDKYGWRSRQTRCGGRSRSS